MLSNAFDLGSRNYMSPQPTETSAVFAPSAPDTMGALGLPASLVTDLVIRRVSFDGTSTLRTLSERLRLSPVILQDVFRR